MKGLPIEPGCTAMIVAPYFQPARGMTVKVEAVCPPGRHKLQGAKNSDDAWLLPAGQGRTWWVTREGGVPVGGAPNQNPCAISEKCLVRIDGPTEEESTLNLSEVNLPAGVLTV